MITLGKNHSQKKCIVDNRIKLNVIRIDLDARIAKGGRCQASCPN